MAQWSGQFSGLTHETKVQDIDASLRQAVTAFNAAPDVERESKSKAVRHLSDRLLAARLKAIRARLSALREPGAKHANDNQVNQLKMRVQDLHTHGVSGILKEFDVEKAAIAEPATRSNSP